MRGRGRAAYLLVAVLAGCARTTDVPGPDTAQSGTVPAPPAAVSVAFEGAPALSVEVASTPAQRALGLMHRTDLPAGTGMLFVFPATTTGGFWMKNTLVPLSIAYVDVDRVVSTSEMIPCPPAAAQCPTYEAAGPYTAAVEAPAGFFPAHGVAAGSRMRVSGAPPAAQ